MAHLVCAVDVGTTSARAGIFDLEGNLHGRSQHPILIRRLLPDWAEHDSEDVWRAVCSAVRGAMAAANARSGDIAGLAFGATSSLVIRGEGGAQIGVGDADSRFDTIMWMDHRAIAQAEAMTSLGGRPVALSGGSVWPEMQAPKLKWLKETRPDAWRAARQAFDLSDFLVWKASGLPVRSRCNLAAKWPWSPDTGWEEGFLDAAGLSDMVAKAGMTGDAVEQGAVAGTLSEQGARALGLAPGVVLAPGMVDAYAGALAVFAGLERDEAFARAAVVAGTSTGIVAASQAPRAVPGVWGPFDGVVLTGLVTCDGGQSASGALLHHVVQTFGARHATLPDIHDRIAARIGELRERDPDFGDRLHVLPDIHGNRSPHGDARARAIFAGIGLDDSFDGLCRVYFRAALAITLGIRQTVEHLNLHGYTIGALHLTGGLSRNPMMNVLHADAVGLPVIETISDDPVLLGGAIAAAASAIGRSLQEMGGRMRQPERTLMPDPANVSRFERDYRIFLRMQEHRRELNAM